MRALATFLFTTALLFSLRVDAAAQGACPDQGVRLVPAEIRPTGEQTCPAIVLGVGLPGIGIVGIRFGGGTCPTAETFIGSHNVCEPKKGYSCVTEGHYVTKDREVTCNTKANLIVIGTGNCSRGPWMHEKERPDKIEVPCVVPPPPPPKAPSPKDEKKSGERP